MQGTIYLLIHEPTKSFYVGSTFNPTGRWTKWKKALQPQGEAPAHMRALGPANEWRFTLVRQFEATPQELEAAEREVLSKVLARTGAVLNSLGATRGDVHGFVADGEEHSVMEWARITGIPRVTIHARIARGWTPEQCVGRASPPGRDHTVISDRHRAVSLASQATTILDDAGQPMLVSEAADSLGVRRDTLIERLKRLRRVKGLTTVALEALRNKRA